MDLFHFFKLMQMFIYMYILFSGFYIYEVWRHGNTFAKVRMRKWKRNCMIFLASLLTLAKLMNAWIWYRSVPVLWMLLDRPCRTITCILWPRWDIGIVDEKGHQDMELYTRKLDQSWVGIGVRVPKRNYYLHGFNRF